MHCIGHIARASRGESPSAMSKRILRELQALQTKVNSVQESITDAPYPEFSLKRTTPADQPGKPHGTDFLIRTFSNIRDLNLTAEFNIIFCLAASPAHHDLKIILTPLFTADFLPYFANEERYRACAAQIFRQETNTLTQVHRFNPGPDTRRRCERSCEGRVLSL